MRWTRMQYMKFHFAFLARWHSEQCISQTGSQRISFPFLPLTNFRSLSHEKPLPACRPNDRPAGAATRKGAEIFISRVPSSEYIIHLFSSLPWQPWKFFYFLLDVHILVTHTLWEAVGPFARSETLFNREPLLWFQQTHSRLFSQFPFLWEGRTWKERERSKALLCRRTEIIFNNDQEQVRIYGARIYIE